MMKRERVAETDSSWICGLATMNNVHSSFGGGSSTPTPLRGLRGSSRGDDLN